jgi:hypothetical protein
MKNSFHQLKQLVMSLIVFMDMIDLTFNSQRLLGGVMGSVETRGKKLFKQFRMEMVQ